MARFKLFSGVIKAGWTLGVGDALRARGNALAVLMLPLVATATATAPPLFRIRVFKRLSILEIRMHDASRCTRGRWQRIDDYRTPSTAQEWTGIARYWAKFTAAFVEDRDRWAWGEDSLGDPNRCHTRAHFNHSEPTNGGLGRGKICKARPSSMMIFGFSPASGKRAGQSEADVVCAAKDRAKRKRLAVANARFKRSAR